MNISEYYQAEIDYRREQVLRDRQAIRLWRRARSTAATKGRTAR